MAMNLEDQVCSFELAKQLKELGVKQESLFYRFDHECHTYLFCKYYEQYSPHVNLNIEEGYASFTASELIELLPHRITLKEGEPFNSFRLRIEKSFVVEEGLIIIYLINYFCDSTECTGENAWLQRGLFQHNIWANNFCNALAKTLIYIIENKYLCTTN